MSKADSNEQIDDDIMQSRADILRAHDIIPGGRKHKAEQTKPAKDTPASSEACPERSRRDTQQQRVEIPKFDLAEKIMAEQRKVVAIKRKAPSKKTEPPPKQEPEPHFAKTRKMGTPETESIKIGRASCRERV